MDFWPRYLPRSSSKMKKLFMLLLPAYFLFFLLYSIFEKRSGKKAAKVL